MVMGGLWGRHNARAGPLDCPVLICSIRADTHQRPFPPLLTHPPSSVNTAAGPLAPVMAMGVEKNWQQERDDNERHARQTLQNLAALLVKDYKVSLLQACLLRQRR